MALGIAGILASVAVDVARVSAARARAQTAADAAALAAVHQLLLPSDRSAADLAGEYAERNGARMISCECPSGAIEAIVRVEIEVAVPSVGATRTVQAVARAVAEDLGLDPHPG